MFRLKKTVVNMNASPSPRPPVGRNCQMRVVGYTGYQGQTEGDGRRAVA